MESTGMPERQGLAGPGAGRGEPPKDSIKPPGSPAGAPPSQPAPPAENWAGPPAGGPNHPPPRRRRRWPWIILIVLVLLLVALITLAILAPWIARGQIRDYVVSQVNQSIAGKVEIDDWSLNWLSPQHITRLRVLDPYGRTVLVAENVNLPATLRSLVFGGRDLGKVEIESLRLSLVIDDKGRTNLVQAFTRARPTGPSRTPSWKGTFDVKRFYGSVQDLSGPTTQPADFDGTLHVGLADTLGGPLTHVLDVAVQSAGQAGRIASTGQITLYHDNRFDPRLADLREQLVLTGAPAVLLNLIPMGGQVVWHSGRLDGRVESTPGTDRAQIAATLDWQALAHLPASGESLEVRSGHTEAAGTAAAGALDLSQFRQTLTAAGQCNESPSQADQQLIDLAGQLAVRWGKAGGADEDAVQLTGWVDLAGLANRLPKLAQQLGLRSDLTLQQGRATFNQFRLAGFGQTQNFSGQLALSQITGTRTGQSVTFSPVTVQGRAELSPDEFAFPGGLVLTAKWAEVRAAGTIRDFQLSTVRPLDLGGLYAELAQFVDMHGWQFAGQLTANATSKSAGPDAPVELAGSLTLGDLQIWHNQQAIIHDRNVVVALNVTGRPGQAWEIRQADVDAQESRLIVLHSKGRYEPKGKDAGLTLAGDYRVNPGPLRALIGGDWPSGVDVQDAGGQTPFSLYWPTGAGPGQGLSAFDRLIRGGRVEAGVTWASANIRGLVLGRPGQPVPVRIASGRLDIGPQQVPGNGGIVTILGDINLTSQTPWLTIRAQQPVPVLQNVQINDAISQKLMPLLNPVLADATSVTGQIQLTINEVQIPLSRQAIKTQGTASGHLKIDNFTARGGLLADLSRMLGVALTGQRGVIDQPIDIRNGRVFFHDSVVRVGASEFSLNGWVSLLSEAEAAQMNEQDTMRLTITIKLTPELLRTALGKLVLNPLGIKPGLAEVPIIIALRGSPHHPKPDFEAFSRELLKAAGQPLTTPLKPLERLFGGGE